MHSMGPAINYNYEVHPYTHVKYGVNVKSHDIVNAITAGLSYSFFQAIILFVCYAFSHKIERDAKVCASNTTEQDYCIIVKL